MSTEIITNLQNQIKLYQQMFEQLENNSGSGSIPASRSPTISMNNIAKPTQTYIKTEDILNLFKISKAEYNNFLVRIN
jgi:hypothetical protein